MREPIQYDTNTREITRTYQLDKELRLGMEWLLEMACWWGRESEWGRD